MKITKIEQQKRKDRVNIYIDDNFALGINKEIMIKYNLKKDMEINDDFIEDILLAEEENKALNDALNFLSYRQRSEKEVSDSLRRKGYTEENIESVIFTCKDKNYINDRNFAESFMRDKVNLNKFGPERIKHELRLKGVSRNTIDEVIDIDREDQYQLAKKVANKRIYSYRNDDKKSIYRKMSGFLQRRGFSYDIVSKVVREIVEKVDTEREIGD